MFLQLTSCKFRELSVEREIGERRMGDYLHCFVALAGDSTGHGERWRRAAGRLLEDHEAWEDQRGGGAGGQRSMAGTRWANRARLQSDTVSTWLHLPWIGRWWLHGSDGAAATTWWRSRGRPGGLCGGWTQVEAGGARDRIAAPTPPLRPRSGELRPPTSLTRWPQLRSATTRSSYPSMALTQRRGDAVQRWMRCSGGWWGAVGEGMGWGVGATEGTGRWCAGVVGGDGAPAG